MDARLVAVFVLSLLAGGMLFSGPSGDPAAGGERVIDCRSGAYLCSTDFIQHRKVDCEAWRPWEDISSLECDKTEEGVGNVSLVADPANYVTAPATNASYEVTTLEGLGSYPWDIEFLPGGDMIWTVMGGKVGVRSDGRTENYTVESVKSVETGLLGLAVHPDFRENRYIYLYYTAGRTGEQSPYQENPLLENRISRFRLTDSGPEDEKILATVPGTKYHSGGRLEFGPDGKLYATTGDANTPRKAGNISYLGGKILRMNPDGSIPEDNPFENSFVYSRGHRNPQGLAWNPATGNLYNSEHGPWRHDEINLVLPGENYGWGAHQCREETFFDIEDRSGIYRAPVRCFDDWTMAPSGMTFVNDTGSPWHGDLFVAGLRGKHVYRMKFDGHRFVSGEVFYNSGDEESISLRLRDVEYRNGSLYVLGDLSGMARITPQRSR